MTLPKLNWKLIGIGAGAVLGVLVLAVVLFFAFFPKELAAREAERRIEEATDRDLVLGGAIDLTFYPALGFSVEQASLSNPRDFDDPARRGGAEEAETPFIAADRIVFAVALLPLLRGDVEVKNLIFEGADVRLRAKPDGATNWSFPTDSEDEEQMTIEDLRLDNVQLIDSRITFQGADGGEPLILEDVDARLTLESLDDPARLDAAPCSGRRSRSCSPPGSATCSPPAPSPRSMRCAGEPRRSRWTAAASGCRFRGPTTRSTSSARR
jgi:AsmA protein